MAAGPAVIGREAELERISAFAGGVADGSGALLIEGEAGVGKTTLWQAGLARTGEDITVLSCRPVQAEATLSFAGLGDLLGGALGGVLDELPAPQRRALEGALLLEDGGRSDHRAVGAGTLSTLRALARDRPVIVAVDDVQWLDRPSGRALAFAFRRLSDEPVRFLAAVRSGAAGRQPPPELVEAFEHTDAQRVRLGPLSVGAVGRLLIERLDLTLPRTVLLDLHETSRGNPLFALELGRALIEKGRLPAPGAPLPVPDDLHALLLERMRRLPSEVRDALLLAALLPHADEDTLARAVGLDWDRAVERGRRADVIDVAGGSVRFIHPLLASALAASASDRQRREAHARLAGAVDDQEARARHLALAATGPDVGVADALEQASSDATRRGAPDSAAELAELARSLTPDGLPHDVCRRSTIAGQARFAAGDSVRALEHFREADAHAAPGPERGGARWRTARVRFHHDDLAASRELLEGARHEAGDDLPLQAAIDSDLAYTCLAMADLRATRQHAKSAVDLAERAGTLQILADALAQVAVADFLLGEGVPTDLMDRARQLEDWDEPRWALVRPSVSVAHIYSWADRIDEARTLLEEAERELLERGDEGPMPFLWYRRAEVDCWGGHWERGYRRALDADRLAKQTSQEGMRSLTCYAVGLLAAHLGRVEEARAYIDQGLSAGAATGHMIGNGLNLSVLGFLELSLGHPDRAHALFAPLVAGGRAGGFDEPGTAWWLADEIEALIALGEHDEAAALTDWLEERARAIDRPTGLATAARCRALLAATAGHVDEAFAACDEALAQHSRVPVPFPRGRTLFAKGQIARRARKWGVARAALEESLAVFERLGATLWADRARDELARIGGRPAAPLELSESERQIAELVAAGRTNREVAEALFVSPRTVSASLARIYRKLGVTSRTEMASRLSRTTPPA